MSEKKRTGSRWLKRLLDLPRPREAVIRYSQKERLAEVLETFEASVWTDICIRLEKEKAAAIQECDSVIAQLAELQWNSVARESFLPPWPQIPPGKFEVWTDLLERRLPQKSGVYFAWIQSSVELPVTSPAAGWSEPSRIVAYVGQSKNLLARVGSRYHNALRPGDLISWLEFPLENLNWAECYYIGILKPPRNFGGIGAMDARQQQEDDDALIEYLQERERRKLAASPKVLPLTTDRLSP